jgi:hypothetical protein
VEEIQVQSSRTLESQAVEEEVIAVEGEGETVEAVGVVVVVVVEEETERV